MPDFVPVYWGVHQLGITGAHCCCTRLKNNRKISETTIFLQESGFWVQWELVGFCLCCSFLFLFCFGVLSYLVVVVGCFCCCCCSSVVAVVVAHLRAVFCFGCFGFVFVCFCLVWLQRPTNAIFPASSKVFISFSLPKPLFKSFVLIIVIVPLLRIFGSFLHHIPIYITIIIIFFVLPYFICVSYVWSYVFHLSPVFPLCYCFVYFLFERIRVKWGGRPLGPKPSLCCFICFVFLGLRIKLGGPKVHLTWP